MKKDNKLADEISFRLLATKKHSDYQWLVNKLKPKKENKIKSVLNNKWVKLLFSLSIMGSAIPSIYQDFTYGSQGEWTHYGMMLVGVLYLTESVLWTLDLWKEKN
tara:strand:- start:420 stop:734 length:315 start_codon:yes stop_codon:yes gene_type:complete